MSDKLKAFVQEANEKWHRELKERMKDMSPQERMEGLSPEEKIKGLSQMKCCKPYRPKFWTSSSA